MDKMTKDMISIEYPVPNCWGLPIGYRVVLHEEDLKTLYESRDLIHAIMSLGGTAIAASGGTTAILVPFIVGYIALELALIKRADKGNGVYLNGDIFSPLVIVPSAIP
jgi:hypothetical protein